ncbi:TPA: hypothetical protein P5977_004474 [Escherichia coli]|nr:hypothetical protein [Escherichia coli]HBD0949713.1 hypothetical protein [Escherichia coli]HDP1611876.1 hypothetical protein [Escherichia coli]HDP5175181.1 hypothetical protein [Escherichia coli]
MMEQLQSDFLFWIFIYFLIVGLLIRNIHLTRKIKFSAQKNLNITHSEPSQAWIEHAYPLQQVTILLQGTRHSEREDIISQLEIIISRLKNGENTGFEHDDDFGYSFQYDAAAVGKSSFFDEEAGRK